MLQQTASLFLVAAVLSAASPKQKPATPAPAPRDLQRRQLSITDANSTSLPEVFVAAGVPTTLAFAQPLKERGVLLADVNGLFWPPQITEKTILLVPKTDPGNAVTTLNVTLADGTHLPFKLVAKSGTADLQLDVTVTLANSENSDALKTTLAQLRGQLDECQATSGAAGLQKVAALILAQDLSKPQAFTVEHRAIHALDKQSRLLVDVRHLYRLFGYSYVVLTVQNRDPAKTWVLDKPEVALEGASEAAQIKVVAYSTELQALPPDEVEKIVIVFTTPEQDRSQTVSLSLLEKNGNRHVKLDGIEL